MLRYDDLTEKEKGWYSQWQNATELSTGGECPYCGFVFSDVQFLNCDFPYFSCPLCDQDIQICVREGYVYRLICKKPDDIFFQDIKLYREAMKSKSESR